MAAKLAVGNYIHVTVCAERGVRYLHEMSLMLIDLRRRNCVPPLFPQIWMANACFCISRALWHAKAATLEPTDSTGTGNAGVEDKSSRARTRPILGQQPLPSPFTPVGLGSVTHTTSDADTDPLAMDWGVRVSTSQFIDDFRAAQAQVVNKSSKARCWDRLYQCLAQLKCVACAVRYAAPCVQCCCFQI